MAGDDNVGKSSSLSDSSAIRLSSKARRTGFDDAESKSSGPSFGSVSGREFSLLLGLLEVLVIFSGSDCWASLFCSAALLAKDMINRQRLMNGTEYTRR